MIDMILIIYITCYGREGDIVTEGAVALSIAGLHLEVVRRIGLERPYCGRGASAHHRLHHPVTVTLRAVRRVQDHVTWKMDK